MEIVIVESPAKGAELVADAICRLVGTKPEAVLGLATGSTPEPVYQELAERRRRGEVDFSSIRGFPLDEYLGLDPGHPASYHAVIRDQVVLPLGLSDHQVAGLDGMADDSEAACADYESQIRQAGGVDLQLLGIGSDGHIGFNEPGSSLGSRTRIKTLTAQTRRDNARFFGGDEEAVPRHCLTQGVGTISEARHLVLMAWGAGKAEALAACAEGPVTAMVPATALQLHRHATVVVDRPAAKRLRLREYYESVYESKPAWQGI